MKGTGKDQEVETTTGGTSVAGSGEDLATQACSAEPGAGLSQCQGESVLVQVIETQGVRAFWVRVGSCLGDLLGFLGLIGAEVRDLVCQQQLDREERISRSKVVDARPQVLACRDGITLGDQAQRICA